MPDKKRRPARRPEQIPCVPDSGLLDDEIAMLRALIRRVHRLAEDEHALEDMLRILDTASLSCSRLAGLLKTRRLLESEPDPAGVMTAVMEAKIEELRKSA